MRISRVLENSAKINSPKNYCKTLNYVNFDSGQIFLEILVDYIFYRVSSVTTWLKTALKKLDNSLNEKAESMSSKTFENRIKVYFYFLTKK